MKNLKNIINKVEFDWLQLAKDAYDYDFVITMLSIADFTFVTDSVDNVIEHPEIRIADVLRRDYDVNADDDLFLILGEDREIISMDYDDILEEKYYSKVESLMGLSMNEIIQSSINGDMLSNIDVLNEYSLFKVSDVDDTQGKDYLENSSDAVFAICELLSYANLRSLDIDELEFLINMLGVNNIKCLLLESNRNFETKAELVTYLKQVKDFKYASCELKQTMRENYQNLNDILSVKVRHETVDKESFINAINKLAYDESARVLRPDLQIMTKRAVYYRQDNKWDYFKLNTPDYKSCDAIQSIVVNGSFKTNDAVLYKK